MTQFAKEDIQVLVVDPHEIYRVRHMLRTAREQSGLAAFPILADPAQLVSATYGVAMQMRIHTEWSNRPATFVIDRSGIIRHARRGTTYSDRPGPAKILEVVRGLEE